MVGVEISPDGGSTPPRVIHLTPSGVLVRHNPDLQGVEGLGQLLLVVGLLGQTLGQTLTKTN